MVVLGSADAPCIMGCGFKTPYRTFLEKSELVPVVDEPSEIMEAGKALEGAVLGLFVARLNADTGQPHVIWKEQPTTFHATRPWQRATPDALLIRYDRETDVEHISLVETKCVVGHVPVVPNVRDLIQCVHQRTVMESAFPEIEHHFLVYFGGLRLVYWSIPRHQAAMDRVLREEERFLGMIERQEPPPLRAEDGSVLHQRWPWSKPETVTLDDAAILNADHVYQETTAEIETLTRQQQQARATLEAAMGTAESARLANGSEYTWRTSPRKGYTVQPSHTRTFKRRKGEDE